MCVPSRGVVRRCVGTGEGSMVRAGGTGLGGGRAGCRDCVLGETRDVLRYR